MAWGLETNDNVRLGNSTFHQFCGNVNVGIVYLNPNFTIGLNVEMENNIVKKTTILLPADTC